MLSSSRSPVSPPSTSPKSPTPRLSPLPNVPSLDVQEVEPPLPPKPTEETLSPRVGKPTMRQPDRPPNTLCYVVDDSLKCPLCKSTSIRQTRASADLCLAILLTAFCFPCGILSFLWVSKVRYCEVCGAEF